MRAAKFLMALTIILALFGCNNKKDDAKSSAPAASTVPAASKNTATSKNTLIGKWKVSSEMMEFRDDGTLLITTTTNSAVETGKWSKISDGHYTLDLPVLGAVNAEIVTISDDELKITMGGDGPYKYLRMK